MTARPKGEGSIYQAADGRWHASMDLGTRANGKRDRRHVSAKTKTAVAKKLRQLRDEAEAGVVGGGRTITVGRWARTWLADCEERLKPLTVAGYRTSVNAYIVPPIGHKRLDRLNRADCEALWRDLANQPKKRGKPGEKLSSGTVHTTRRALRACLSEALDRGMVARNAAADARPPRLVEQPRTWHTKDEARAVVVAASKGRNGARWVIAFLGLRQGEALGLCWDDLDLSESPPRISISRTVYRATWRHGCRNPAGCTYLNAKGLRCKTTKAAQCPSRIGGGLVVGTPKSSAGHPLLHPAIRDVGRARRPPQGPGCRASGRGRGLGDRTARRLGVRRATGRTDRPQSRPRRVGQAAGRRGGPLHHRARRPAHRGQPGPVGSRRGAGHHGPDGLVVLGPVRSLPAPALRGGRRSRRGHERCPLRRDGTQAGTGKRSS